MTIVWAPWTRAGMRFWVVSDVAAPELDELARLPSQAPEPASRPPLDTVD
jgi:hypothetical protein